MKWQRTAAAVLGFLGVLLGAFGAHRLKSIVPADALEIWKTAVFYHLVHAPVLLWQTRYDSRFARWTFLCLFAGVLLFSGSLYWLVWSGIRFWGWLTPFGGVLMLVGWGMLAWQSFHVKV
ncbi:MAG: DUF423 domain-containing protein [Gammaproteobacteria bacterium]|nr:MAG: DUF423 domain-containing protein [Gammaproteobacteria bacterium]